jgi:hypothetical protein
MKIQLSKYQREILIGGVDSLTLNHDAISYVSSSRYSLASAPNAWALPSLYAIIVGICQRVVKRYPVSYKAQPLNLRSIRADLAT